MKHNRKRKLSKDTDDVRKAQYKRESLSRLSLNINQAILTPKERRQRTHTRSDQTFPFLDISSGNFRISFYIINRSRVKMCRRFFLNEYFLGCSAQSRRAHHKREHFWMKFLFFKIFHLLIQLFFFDVLDSPCYPDIWYFFLPFF